MPNLQNYYPSQSMLIAGPIYLNRPIYIGPEELSESLLQPTPMKPKKLRQKEVVTTTRPILKNTTDLTLQQRDAILQQWSFQETNQQPKLQQKPQPQPQPNPKPSVKFLETRRSSSNSEISYKVLQAPSEKKARKLWMQRQLRIHMKAFFFYVYYFNHLKKLLMKKKELQVMKENSNILLNEAFKLGSEWTLSFLHPILQKFWKVKERLDWLENQQLSDKEQNKRMQKVKSFVDSMVDVMLKQVRETTLDHELLQFLAQITQNYEFPPDQYYFNFEITRLQFTSLGALKQMTHYTQKMIIACFIIIRIIGFTILYAPWTLGLQGIVRNETLQGNSLIITSVFHELVVSEFKDVPQIDHNQNHLSLENKVQPRQLGPYKIIPDPNEMSERKRLKNLVNEMIHPIYTQDQLKLLYNKEEKWLDSTKDKLDEIYSRLMKIVGMWHSQNKIKLSIRTKRMK